MKAERSCPFCGFNDVRLNKQNIKSQTTHQVQCINCAATGPVFGDKTSALKGWNDGNPNPVLNVISYKKLVDNTPQAMTYQEREDLKFLASELSEIKDADSLRDLLVMIAHWMRQLPTIPFSLYASNWIHADRDVSKKLKEAFPLHGQRMIHDRCSDWNSFNHPSYTYNTHHLGKKN